MSTNLAMNGWLPLGRYMMPQGTNSYAFTVSSNDVAFAYRPFYVDSFSRMAFFRFGLDFDSDGDGLTDSYESFVSFTDPSNPDTDGDGLTNQQEAEAGTSPTNSDTDGDGLTDGVEVGQGSDPNDRADTIPVKWVSVTGDLDQNVPKQVRETVTIPAGTMAFVGVFLQSDEYPDYTSTGSEFNDRAVWDIHADGNTPLSGFTLVNNEDGAWDTAAANSHAAHGYSPVVLKDKAIYKASAGADLSITVNLAAMNISDSIRPTTVFVGVFPLKVVQANMPTATGVANTTDAATSYFRAFIPTNGVACQQSKLCVQGCFKKKCRTNGVKNNESERCCPCD